MTIREWLQVQEPDFYSDGIFKLVPRWDKYINVLGDNAEKNNDTSGINGGTFNVGEFCFNLYDLGNITY